MFQREDIATEVTSVRGVFSKDVFQVQARGDEAIASMCRLGVVVPGHNDRVSPSSLLHKLEDFKHLAVPVARVKLCNIEGTSVVL